MVVSPSTPKYMCAARMATKYKPSLPKNFADVFNAELPELPLLLPSGLSTNILSTVGTRLQTMLPVCGKICEI